MKHPTVPIKLHTFAMVEPQSASPTLLSKWSSLGIHGFRTCWMPSEIQSKQCWLLLEIATCIDSSRNDQYHEWKVDSGMFFYPSQLELHQKYIEDVRHLQRVLFDSWGGDKGVATSRNLFSHTELVFVLPLPVTVVSGIKYISILQSIQH